MRRLALPTAEAPLTTAATALDAALQAVRAAVFGLPQDATVARNAGADVARLIEAAAVSLGALRRSVAATEASPAVPSPLRRLK